jgi:hypothetical protein
LFLGAKGASEGGQLILQKGISQVSASHLDNYQDQFRVMRGSDSGSTAVDFSVSHISGQVTIPKYTSAGSFSGTSVAFLAVDSVGNVLTSTGTAGAQGNQGRQGDQGFQGRQGPTGDQGRQGPQGDQGRQGSQGDQGAQGRQGPQGDRGFQGFQGDRGFQGFQGDRGFQGFQGPQGDRGFQGFQGNQGPTGLQGTTGAQGNQGPTGLQGTTGAQGNQGPTGLQGIAGAQGNQGPTGLQGTAGTNGTNGTNGVQGAAGPQGNLGPQGNTGAASSVAGPQGNVGAQGAAGPNVYTDTLATVTGRGASTSVQMQQNSNRFVRDSVFRTISGQSDNYTSGTSGWYEVATIILTGNCSGAVLYGTLYDNRFDGADTYQIAVVARAECSFTSNNEDHYINVGCTILGSTNYTNYRDKIRVVLVASSTNSRTYELQFFETPWNNDTWQLETTGWTIFSSPQTPGSAVGTPRVNYISTKNADNIRANTTMTVGGNTVWHAGNLTNLNQLTNGPGYITGYTETDTLNSVTSRGASTANNITLSGGGNLFNGHHYFSPYDADGNHYPHYNVGGSNNGSKLNLRMFSGNGGTIRLFSLNGQTGAISWDGNTIWHAGNFTPGNYLPLSGGTLTGPLQITGARLTVSTGGVNTYGIVAGYENNNHMMTFRAAVTGNTTSPTFTASHQMTFIEFAQENDTTGWYFKSASTGTYEEIARITRSTFNYKGNTVIHSGNIGSQSVNYSNYSNYISNNYNGGVSSNPQTYFGQGIGVKVAMTGQWGVWSDTLWINGYGGGDVLQMCALHTQRNGTPRMGISVQASNSTSYGTIYEFITSYNIASQTVSSASTVTHFASRTDGTYYNVIWGAGNPSHMYSCDAVQIQSSTGTLRATNVIVSATLNLPNNALINVNSEPDIWGARFRTTASTTNLGGQLKNIIFCGGGVAEGFAITGVGTGSTAFEVTNGGNAFLKDSLYVNGANSRIQAGSTSVDGMLYDSSGRPALVARAAYPHIELWADVNNGNHGGTLRFGGYDNGSSGAYKNWNIGTPGSDLYFLDIAYGGNSNSNPHSGIAGLGTPYGYTNAFNMMRFHNNGNIGVGNFGTYGSEGNTPAFKLDVRGTGRFTGAVSANTSLTVGGGGDALAIAGAEGRITFRDQALVWTGYVGFRGNLGVVEFPGRNVQISCGYNGNVEINTGTNDYLSGVLTVPFGSVNARRGFTSNDNPWGTANSSYHPNGITTGGSTNWVYGTTYIGNAPSNGSGAEVAANGRSYFRSSNTSGVWGFAGQYVDRSNAANNYVPWSFESEYGNHSWGIVARFHIQQSGADRPAIQFSSASSNTRWSVGYCYYDDNFRITQNQGYRIDGSGVSDGWGTERFRINTDGVTSISNRLNVSSTSGRGVSIGDGTYANHILCDSGVDFAFNYGNGNTGGFGFFGGTSSAKFMCSSAGTLTVSGDVIAYGTPSDARLKDIKEKIPNALESVLKLNGYRFDWKERELNVYGDDKKILHIKEDIGVIAQEVEALFPELARTNEDGFMSVRYQGLTAVLIEAIKELKAEIDELKSQK